ncbi:hypothetical protein KSZ_16970 [Dictyobacter formicarum]|uniref:Uncharacterized protein n=1 Tax=Dictyobacter formicarum TaxID=2778368 RepID=A0ABQ3VDA4_9CHLR|nr:hypothetical protein KSZ_16970 [Dictyobacter formicarum]
MLQREEHKDSEQNIPLPDFAAHSAWDKATGDYKETAVDSQVSYCQPSKVSDKKAKNSPDSQDKPAGPAVWDHTVVVQPASGHTVDIEYSCFAAAAQDFGS